MSHTPGPWVAIKNRVTCTVKSESGDYVMESRSIRRDDDANLIAAAPDLLAACKEAKKHLEPDLVEPGRTVFWNLVAAIAKAESPHNR